MKRDDRPDVDRAIAQRVQQGLEPRVTDPAVLAYLGALVAQPTDQRLTATR